MLIYDRQPRCGVTIIELIIVIGIISFMLGLLIPAVLSSRRKARDLVCKNNLYQIGLAVSGFQTISRRAPERDKWTVEILPWLAGERGAGFAAGQRQRVGKTTGQSTEAQRPAETADGKNGRLPETAAKKVGLKETSS